MKTKQKALSSKVKTEAKKSQGLQVLANDTLVDQVAEDIAVLKTLIEQDLSIIGRARKHGVDPRNTFRCFGVEDSEGFVFHIATSGVEGLNYAQKFFEALSKSKHFVVENDTRKRFEFRDTEIRESLKELIGVESEKLEETLIKLGDSEVSSENAEALKRLVGVSDKVSKESRSETSDVEKE